MSLNINRPAGSPGRKGALPAHAGACIVSQFVSSSQRAMQVTAGLRGPTRTGTGAS
jgi:hypothetical protein